MSARVASASVVAALIAFTLGGCANNVERTAKLECARLRHLATSKAVRIDRKAEAAACRGA